MKKLSKIDESVWADIYDRSTGETVRKEDDVQNMDVEEFWLYLIKKYKDQVYNLDKDHFCREYDIDIVISPIKEISIYGSYIKDELSRIMVVLKNTGIVRLDNAVKNLINLSPKNFKWIKRYSDRLDLQLNNGDITNKTYIDLVDLLLNNQIFESIWADIYDRSAGDTVRKEDDVDIKTPEDFFDYLTSHYKIDNSPIDLFFDTKMERIRIPFCLAGPKNLKVCALFYDYKYNILYMYSNCKQYIPDLWNKLDDNFNLRKDEPDYQYFTIINPKDTKRPVNNSYVLEVINFIIDNMDEQDNVTCSIFRKEMNESVWADIYDRSTGDTVRKEDLILTNDDLKDKIKQLYEEQGEGDVLDVSSISNLIVCNDFSYIFYGPVDLDECPYRNVKHIIGLETWDVSKVTDMEGMFSGCYSLTKLNISNWNVSNVTDMYNMFFDCQFLTKLDLSNWDVSKVRDMNCMFYDCQSLTKLDLSNWDVSKVKDMNCMFHGCHSLTELNIDNWDVSNVTDMRSMFYHCDKIKKPKWYKR